MVAIYSMIAVATIIFLISLMVIFNKMGKSAVNGLIPVYNVYVLTKSLKVSKVLFLMSVYPIWAITCLVLAFAVPPLMLILYALSTGIPSFNVSVEIKKVLELIMCISFLIWWAQITWRLAKVFGKEKWYAILLFFLAPIFMPILAFGKSEYIETKNDSYTALTCLCSKIKKTEAKELVHYADIYMLAKELEVSKVLIWLSMPVLIITTPVFIISALLLYWLVVAIWLSLPYYIIDILKVIFGISLIAFLIMWTQISWRLATGFGKGKWYAILLFFLAPIFIPVLAFGKSEYIDNKTTH